MSNSRGLNDGELRAEVLQQTIQDYFNDPKQRIFY